MERCTSLATNCYRDFKFNEPSENWLDLRLAIFCICPIVAQIMMYMTLQKNKELEKEASLEPAPATASRRNWVDITKWGVGSAFAFINPLTISILPTVSLLFALSNIGLIINQEKKNWNKFTITQVVDVILNKTSEESGI